MKIAIEKDSPFKFSFECDNNFIVEYLPLLFEKKDFSFFVGSNRESKLGGSFNVDLSEENRYLVGNTDAVEDGFQIYYDAILKRWNVLFHSHEPLFTFIDLKGKFRNMRVHSEKKIWSNKPYYLLSDKKGYSKAFLKMDDKIRFVSKAVCGDFDNDGDLDIFGVKNENDSRNNHVLLQNDGQGSFTVIVNPAGNYLFSNLGIKGVLSKADYDNDGDLDILVASGNSSPLREDQQRYCLLNNLTNNSNYLTLALQGTKSNRDAIGATIIAYVEGKAQMREQDGGMARRSQSDSRIHFGLGNHYAIDSLFVYWPSGLKQKLENISCNQILSIIEQK